MAAFARLETEKKKKKEKEDEEELLEDTLQVEVIKSHSLF